MAAYIVATVRVSNPEAFGAYAKAIDGLAEQHGGEYLLRGPVTELLEGSSAPGERIVVLRFPDADSARSFYRSETYQAGKALRDGAAELVMRLIEDPK